jgi:nitrite reductase/ring-hydroxylating ferredoxin subunit
MAAHLGGELSYHYGLRVDRNVFEETGPDEFVAVLDETDLPADSMRRVDVEGVSVLLSRSSGSEVCAIAATCNHFSGPLEQGEREGNTVVCPLHSSRFDLCSGEVIDGPAVFPQSRYETRLREGKIEVKAAAENVQQNVK